MGQTPNGQSLPSTDYSTIRELPNGSIIKDHATSNLHFLKEYSFTNQQTYQQAFVNFSKKLPQKHQHILFLQRTNTKLENTFCSTFYKISLIYEYLEHTLQNEIEERSQQSKVFDEKQVWSVLCSCVLGVSEMIRTEGRSHAALKAKDIRLNEEGLVKILSLEMVGMDKDHDLNKEGSTKQLATTILSCLTLEEITNNATPYLTDMIDQLDCTTEMKNILKMMLNQQTKFVQLEEYLFRMVQEETDSLNSYSNTPNMKQRAGKNDNSYSKIPEESKEDDSLMPLTRDQEDQFDRESWEPVSFEEQVPDENDTEEESKTKYSESGHNTLREGITPEMSGRDSKVSNRFNNTDNNSLFTDPKLLNLIHTDLQEIKKRKSTTNSRKLGISDSKFSVQQRQEPKTLQTQQLNIPSMSELKENQSCYSYSKNQTQQQQFKHINLVNVTSLPSIPNKQNEVKQSPKETKQNRSIKTTLNIRSESQQVGWNSQKEIADFCSNPEKKKAEKRVENIMDIEEMGFKKNKNKVAEEQSRVTSNLNNSQAVNTIIYNSNESSRPIEAKISTVNYLERSRDTSSRISKKNELEYVTETYLRGRYEGTKLNNMRHGKGVFYYNQGGKYIGEWKENKMCGKGVLYYPNNEIAYDGDWKNDQLEGKGTLYNQEVIQLTAPFDYKDWDDVEDYWIKYEGQFSEDSKNGEGKLYLSNGEIFEGSFKEDMVWGEGMLSKRDGGRVRGLWRENKLVRLY